MKFLGRALCWLSAMMLIGLVIQIAAVHYFGTGIVERLRDRPFPSHEEIALRNERDLGLKGVISGQVMWDDGTPAAGFLVQAHFTGRRRAEGEGAAVTDGKGRYRIHGLDPQDFLVSVDESGQLHISDPAQIIHLTRFPGTTDSNVNFTIHQGPQITVRVRDAQTGVGVAGIVVKGSFRPMSRSNVIGVTDARGELCFRSGLPETTVSLDTIHVRKLLIGSKYQTYKIIQPANSGAIHDAVLDFKVKDYPVAQASIKVALHGTVTGLDGQAAGGVEMQMSAPGRSENYRTLTNADGEFVFPPFYTRAEGSEGNGQTARGTAVWAERGNLTAVHYTTPDETVNGISMHLAQQKHASFIGVLLDPQGKPAPGVRVACCGSFVKASGYFQKDCGVTNANGRFTASGLSSEAEYSFIFGGAHLWNTNAADYKLQVVPDPRHQGKHFRLREGEQRDLGTFTVSPVAAAAPG